MCAGRQRQLCGIKYEFCVVKWEVRGIMTYRMIYDVIYTHIINGEFNDWFIRLCVCMYIDRAVCMGLCISS